MSSSELQSLYQEIILDHSRQPIGFGGLTGDAAGRSHQLNPTCGDEVTLELDVDDAGLVGLRWEGHGCAISQASASLLSELVERGLTIEELSERIDVFRTAMRSRGAIEPDEELLGDAAALGGVSRYIARVKCAMLAWVAAEEAVARARA
ncbi:SUF system NifU family Fe-S cluster assembly protein [Salinibacterium sp. SYSU T00001]|uniref:Fe-S cluster assembly sulfur transfer protein SufU n=1 Tax=Homoserinimonas sedimenticola TaxID=2986805 RepID=UPI002236B25C|nr:SUF system NifU family Fe-S cluster assembly protein [Salinibacterium sedimenticola]MCW4384227.1 SUF system NifU family Fe-S cluster assembly protein [Salinibacterium sedimenticola]